MAEVLVEQPVDNAALLLRGVVWRQIIVLIAVGSILLIGSEALLLTVLDGKLLLISINGVMTRIGLGNLRLAHPVLICVVLSLIQIVGLVLLLPIVFVVVVVMVTDALNWLL